MKIEMISSVGAPPLPAVLVVISGSRRWGVLEIMGESSSRKSHTDFCFEEYPLSHLPQYQVDSRKY
jgi:hypothetical protein